MGERENIFESIPASLTLVWPNVWRATIFMHSNYRSIITTMVIYDNSSPAHITIFSSHERADLVISHTQVRHVWIATLRIEVWNGKLSLLQGREVDCFCRHLLLCWDDCVMNRCYVFILSLKWRYISPRHGFWSKSQACDDGDGIHLHLESHPHLLLYLVLIKLGVLVWPRQIVANRPRSIIISLVTSPKHCSLRSALGDNEYPQVVWNSPSRFFESLSLSFSL